MRQRSRIKSDLPLKQTETNKGMNEGKKIIKGETEDERGEKLKD
jgi:hypothetical protein